MPKSSSSRRSSNENKHRPALTPEARENEMINLAIDLAEQKLRDGSASSPVIVHYLKLASTKERLEKEIMEKQKELISAKTEALQSSKDAKEIAEKALEAMRRYAGIEDQDYGEEDIY